MELLRFTNDVFGQRMLVGVNWDYLWLPVAAALAFITLHIVIRTMRRKG